MKIVVTIPAYNEGRKIGDVVSRVKKVMKGKKYNFKILVVDDGSRDSTASAAKEAGAIVYSNPVNLGLAETFRIEIRKCLELGAELIVHIDADGQYLPEEIPKLIDKFKEGYDLVLGSRFVGTIEHMPWLKRWGNKAFSRVISSIIKHKITDCQTGFRVFSKKVAQSIDIISDHTYTQEQIIKAIRGGFKAVEVGVYFAKRKGRSRLLKNPLEYAVKAWVNLFRIYRDYKPLKFFGIFGFWMVFFGVLIGLYFLVLHFSTGIRGHTGLLFLMLLLFFVGIQVILFGFLADMIKR
ncbi:MAG: glycosyltransferase family 2 protein [Nanoarchaeota archaeon]|nr:glycosyltransferase family 2 protein [Nanoarchaeota archaeon]